MLRRRMLLGVTWMAWRHSDICSAVLSPWLSIVTSVARVAPGARTSCETYQ